MLQVVCLIFKSFPVLLSGFTEYSYTYGFVCRDFIFRQVKQNRWDPQGGDETLIHIAEAKAPEEETLAHKKDIVPTGEVEISVLEESIAHEIESFAPHESVVPETEGLVLEENVASEVDRWP